MREFEHCCSLSRELALDGRKAIVQRAVERGEPRRQISIDVEVCGRKVHRGCDERLHLGYRVRGRLVELLGLGRSVERGR